MLIILYYLFRRTAPRLTYEALQKALTKYADQYETNKGCEMVEPTKTLRQNEIDSIAQAFENNLENQWLTFNNNPNISLSGSKEEEKEEDFFLNMCLKTALSYGNVLVLRDKEKDNQLLGVAALANPGHPFKDMHFFRGMGFKKPSFVNKKAKKEGWEDAVNVKFDALVNQSEKFHHQHFKNQKHWYLQILGVVQDAQGKGVGKKLLDCCFALAHESGHPLYLECNDDNVPYYEKRGFRKLGDIRCIPKPKKKLKNRLLLEFEEFNLNGMIWESGNNEKNQIIAISSPSSLSLSKSQLSSSYDDEKQEDGSDQSFDEIEKK
ncbi:gnat family acetyltransferase [Anaeramoeba flamelloides]|uniref:Gnat family acetyltransferase n=1 Tax=Anaeramoeba flamelloides TaxID=1746091 RepID=A0AAV7Z0I6_9EUKA|nr:gnat family acetyltransferase [Anaeramoeba flamelloides]